MKAVWLSSTYYLDEAVQQLSPNAERMLTRAMAYCGNAETSGFVAENAINLLGLPRAKRLVQELVNAEILIPRPGGGWDFRSWESWNSAGDALIARRKADRERQARLREEKRKSRDVSRDKSRDVTPPEESREEKNSSYVPLSATDSNGRGSVAATPAADLIREVVPSGHPPATLTALRIQASELLNTGADRADVKAAIQLWCDKPGVGIGRTILASLTSEVIKSRVAPSRPGGRVPASDAAFAAAQALKSTPTNGRLEIE